METLGMSKRSDDSVISVSGTLNRETQVGQDTPPEISLWVLDEPFEFGVLPMQPSAKIGVSLLRKVSAYIKTKNMYPILNLSSWMHISQLKLQMGACIPWIYLRMFDILKQQMSRRDRSPGYWDVKCEQFRKGRKDKKDEFRVPTFQFLVFLYIQNSFKIMKRLSVQMTNLAKRQADWWPIKSSEPKIQNEQLHYQYVYDNIEELIDYLQEGYKTTDEIPVAIIEALNLLLCFTTNPRECVDEPLEKVVASRDVAPLVNFNAHTQTVNRRKFVDWVRHLLKLNPWGSASSFVHSPKIHPCSGPTRKDSRDVAHENRIIFNGQKPPYAWEIMSNVCHQVLYHCQNQEFSHLKIHRCNNSYLYVPGLYNSVLVDKCINSTVFLGVTSNVVKLFGCSNVKVYCVSRLVIITDCTNSTFYLLTPTQPVLTGSKNDGIQLAPYNTCYPFLSEHLILGDFKAGSNNWNEPLVIGIDGISVESMSPVTSFMSPSEFEICVFPFGSRVPTKEDLLTTPDSYIEAFGLNELEFNQWRQEYLDEAISTTFSIESELTILNSFRAWLISSGTGKELDGLINLQNALENKRDKHGKIQADFEFSEAHQMNSKLTTLFELLGTSVNAMEFRNQDAVGEGINCNMGESNNNPREIPNRKDGFMTDSSHPRM